MAELTKKDLNRMFWRMQLMMVTSNFESQQAVGFFSSISPALEKIYKDSDEETTRKAMKRHLVFYNSHIVGNALILGIIAALEETTSEDEKESVVSMKTGLMGPLAGLGDSLIKFTWLPICGSIGAAMAASGNILGPILMFLMYNLANQGLRYFGIHQGYTKGIAFLTGNKDSNIIQRISSMANVIGLMVVGALIASAVSIATPLTMKSGDEVLKLQEMLDNIMPNLLSFVFVFFIYKILKKNNAKHVLLMIIAIMALSILLVNFGIL